MFSLYSQATSSSQHLVGGLESPVRALHLTAPVEGSNVGGVAWQHPAAFFRLGFSCKTAAHLSTLTWHRAAAAARFGRVSRPFPCRKSELDRMHSSRQGLQTKQAVLSAGKQCSADMWEVFK